jgi:cobyrinic acid a,c-diamide synthase
VRLRFLDMDGSSSPLVSPHHPPSARAAAVRDYHVPRVVVAGTGSGVGKTTVATGLMAALSERGLRVQAFKVGPDYIDPSYHAQATHRHSRNLDSYMLSGPRIVDSLVRSSADADISVIEGVMGLYDGVSGLSDAGSTASVAKLLRAPVVLVLDAWSSARSIAASALGFRAFDPKVNLAGVILNKVAGEKHAKWCTDAIERRARVPVLGWLPKSDGVQLPERHLGLIPYAERDARVERAVSKLGEFIGERVDLIAVEEIARSAPPIRHIEAQERARKDAKATVGIAVDDAFSFYYADAIDLLRTEGADIVNFSPLHDPSLPEGLDGIYIGGGFPESFSAQLEENGPMRTSIKKRLEDGMPAFAECGGLMYLTRSITDFRGPRRSMVGVFDGETVMTNRLTLGYTLASAKSDSIISKAGESLRGHEYHFSQIQSIPDDASFAYEMIRGDGISGRREGWQEYNTLGCYSHVHLCSKPRTATRFVEACLGYSRG